MRKRKRLPRREVKSRQVHFWVSPELVDYFERAARESGIKLTDAHRQALQYFIDRNVDEGTTFVTDAQLQLGRHRVLARLFNRRDELIITVRGAAVSTVLDLLRLAGSETDFTHCIERIAGNATPRASSAVNGPPAKPTARRSQPSMRP